jgi:quinol monooxygenase YgiN
MVIVLGKITLQTADEAERVLSALIARAKKSRADAGNLEYSFSRSLEDSKEVLLTEVWESEDLLMAHLQIPDPDFNSVLATAKIEKAIVKAYDGANERVLMAR